MRYFLYVVSTEAGIEVQIDVNSRCTEDLELVITSNFEALVLSQVIGSLDPYRVLHGELPSTYIRYYGSTPTNYSVLKDVYSDCTDDDMLTIATGFPEKLRNEIFKDKEESYKIGSVIYSFTNVGVRLPQ